MVKYLLCVSSMIIKWECSHGVCLTVFFIAEKCVMVVCISQTERLRMPDIKESYCRELLHKFLQLCVFMATQKKRELLKTPTKIEEIQEKKFIDRNWTITTCLLIDSNPNYQCLKITSCRWRPPRMHSFTATTHFKSSRSFVSPCVCCMLCRMRQSRHTQRIYSCLYYCNMYGGTRNVLYASLQETY